MKFIITSLICFFTLFSVLAQEVGRKFEIPAAVSSELKKGSMNTSTANHNYAENPSGQIKAHKKIKKESNSEQPTTEGGASLETPNQEDNEIESPKTTSQEALAPRTKSKEHTLKAIDFKTRTLNNPRKLNVLKIEN